MYYTYTCVRMTILLIIYMYTYKYILLVQLIYYRSLHMSHFLYIALFVSLSSLKKIIFSKILARFFSIIRPSQIAANKRQLPSTYLMRSCES